MEACVSASDQAVDRFTCNDICMADRFCEEMGLIIKGISGNCTLVFLMLGMGSTVMFKEW